MISIRTYTKNDLQILTDLHNKMYSGYNCVSEKSTSQWKSIFVDHPDIGKERILVASYKERIIGYAAYAVKLPPLIVNRIYNGYIYEVCYCKENMHKKTIDLLVLECIKASGREGVSKFQIHLPLRDKAVINSLKKYGLVQMNTKFMVGLFATDLKTMCFEIFQVKNITDTIVFNIIHDFSDKFVKFGENGIYSFKTGVSETTDFEITIGNLDLLDILFDKKPIYKKIIDKKISVKPLSKTLKAALVLHKMRAKNDWCIPSIEWK
jgi:hypothetical protein